MLAGAKVRTNENFLRTVTTIQPFAGTIVDRIYQGPNMVLVETASGERHTIHRSLLTEDSSLELPATTYRYFDAGDKVCPTEQAITENSAINYFVGTVVRRQKLIPDIPSDAVMVVDESGKEHLISCTHLKEYTEQN